MADSCGSPTGGATVTSPGAGWSNPDLEVYFGKVAPTGTREPTRPVSTATPTKQPAVPSETGSHHTNVGAIAGGAVGGVVGLLIILGAVLCCIRQRKKRRVGPNQVSSPPVIHHQPSESIFYRASSPPNNSRHFSGTSEPPKPVPSPQMTDVSDHGSQYRTPSGGSPAYFAGGASSGWSQPGQHSPPPSWQPMPVYYVPVQPGQQPQFYTTSQPPQRPVQQYYPPPPDPQQYGPGGGNSPSEMPSIRSPAQRR
jgi:hypothetical protein